MAKLSTAQRKAMPAKEFAGGKPKGEKTGRFPLNDKAHIKAAESYERFATPAEKAKIDAAAKKAFPERGQRTATHNDTKHPGSHDEWESLGK
ncbi:hypothetical protein F0160_22625 [Paraburkholderia sp. JPY303]|uniref:hypothetical protein n=1 Tax=Paraburkholderia atlantica TaxID=2654982 RepID=UPI0015914620|nr:hypothetical protein [Paraburkholderia atlantica]NUY33283.1 hypothetical protein [Paraburkholderia atlantica]